MTYFFPKANTFKNKATMWEEKRAAHWVNFLQGKDFVEKGKTDRFPEQEKEERWPSKSRRGKGMRGGPLGGGG